MKKIISLILCVIFMVCLSACGSDNTSTNGKDPTKDSLHNIEENFEWDGNLIVGLSDKGCEVEEIIIPERCEGFGGAIFADKDNNVEKVTFAGNSDISLNGVFTSAKKIRFISLPEGLIQIGNMDFWLCESLEEIKIPSSVATVGEAAFQKCSGLKKVVFGDKVSEIQEYAFDGCSSLNTIVFDDAIETIGEYAFYECTSLEKVVLPKALKNVGAFAFANSGIADIMVPSEVSLDSYATTSFVQADHDINVHLTEGSWMDQNFDAVFSGAYIKNYK